MYRLTFFPLLLLLCTIACGSDGKQRANIIVILVDDMGFSDLSCYGGEIPTPNLDRLAENGLRYAQFHNTGRCCPTRASLITGLYAHRAGVGMMMQRRIHPGYQGALNDQCVTIGDVASAAGYVSLASGKWHLGSRNKQMWPTGRGFDHFYGVPEGGGVYKLLKKGRSVVQDERVLYDHENQVPEDWYCVDAFTDQAIRMADQAIDREQPFLLYLSHIAPHFPVQADVEDIEPFVDLYLKGYDELNRLRIERQRQHGLLDSIHVPAKRPKDVPAWDELTPKQQDRMARLMATYVGVMTRMDRAVGRLVLWLRKREQYDNTIILFLSDNGESAESGVSGRTDGDPTRGDSNWWIGKSWAWLCNTPFRKFKMDNDEGGIATPLIVHWPARIKHAGWRHQVGHVIDIMPTVVELTGGRYPENFSGREIAPLAGRSLVPTFEISAETQEKRTLGWEHMGNAAYRDGDWKIVRTGVKGAWRLYDLSKDRTEQIDLSKHQPARTNTLVEQWHQWASDNNVSTNGLPR